MSGHISKDFIQNLIAHTNIVEIVSGHVTITKKGKDHTGCCPFHQEKTPSFTVSIDKQFYHCFGCGAHGNAIDFLIAYSNQTFPEAIQTLADLAGIQVEYDSGTQPNTEQYSKLYNLLDKASQLYSSYLEKHPIAQQYLQSRGLTPAILQQYQIGYAPDKWQNLIPITESAETTSSLIATGMMIQKENNKDNAYDRFRGRVMFPIRNTQGKVVGFGGRIITDGTPKYLNSPETILFHKNNELYGLYEARKAQSKLPYVIVVEGYMDVVALAQYKLNMAIATLGTAVNEQHIKKILRYTKRIIFCFDGDNAGQKASWNALLATMPSLTQGVDVKFLKLKDKQDPDSFIRQYGSDAFKAELKQAPRIEEKLFIELQNRFPLDTLANKSQFAHEASKCIQTIPAGFYRDLMLVSLAEKLNMSRNNLQNLIKQPGATDQHTKRQPINNMKRKPSFKKIHLRPSVILANTLLVHYPYLITNIDIPSDLPSPTTIELKMLTTLLSLLQQSPKLTTGQICAQILDADLKKHFAELAHETVQLPEEALKDELQGALQHIKTQHRQEKINGLIHKSKQEPLDEPSKQQLQQLINETNNDKEPQS
jgi:DNA primase